MGRVRVFYGHEGVVPPTGSRARSAAAPAPVEDEVDEVVSIDPDGEQVELVGEVIEDGAAVAPGEVLRVDGSEVPVGDDGIPVLGDEDLVDDDEADDADADEVDEQDGGVELPDESWTKADLLTFAEEKGIDMTGAKKTQPLALARILENLKES